MAIDQKYIRKISGIKYILNAINMTRLKDKDKAQIKS